MLLQIPLELFVLPLLESLIPHWQCALRSVGVDDTHMYCAGTHIGTLAHANIQDLLYV